MAPRGGEPRGGASLGHAIVLVIAALLSIPRVVQASPAAKLPYPRGPCAERCPDEAALRQAVAFVPPVRLALAPSRPPGPLLAGLLLAASGSWPDANMTATPSGDVHLARVIILRPIAEYTRVLRPELSAATFLPARSRLLWLPVHVGIIAASTFLVARHEVPWPLVPFLSGVIGACFAGLTFFAHEALHGGIVRGKRLRTFVGWVGFLPFVISPRLWVAWHNRVHHGHTAEPSVDPDTYPTLREYGESRVARVMTDHFALGYHHRGGAFSVLVGFTGQSGHMLVAGRGVGLSARQHRLAVLETLAGVAVWTAVGALVGPLAFVFVFVLPLVVANTIVMTFILTNHGLSPQTDVNDPLVNSLSVTSPRWYDWLTLGFGAHVEHHLFPSMSSRHAPQVRALLRTLWPERYQSMPFGRALLGLMRTGRVYKTPTSLFDPRTGREWPTLAPRVVMAETAPVSARRAS